MNVSKEDSSKARFPTSDTMISRSSRRALGFLWPGVVPTAIMVATLFQLRGQGRVWWCACGQPSLWSADAWGEHNSQHVFDPYSLTHMLHGMIFWGLLTTVCPRLSPNWRLCLAVIIESSWEIFENSEFTIDRYRAATAALGYTGDSLANSAGDILSCVVGFELAKRLGWRASVWLALASELVLLIWIRDSLFLNVVMLICPIEAVKDWQMAR